MVRNDGISLLIILATIYAISVSDDIAVDNSALQVHAANAGIASTSHMCTSSARSQTTKAFGPMLAVVKGMFQTADSA